MEKTKGRETKKKTALIKQKERQNQIKFSCIGIFIYFLFTAYCGLSMQSVSGCHSIATGQED
jgi:hypothetical protein